MDDDRARHLKNQSEELGRRLYSGRLVGEPELLKRALSDWVNDLLGSLVVPGFQDSMLQQLLAAFLPEPDFIYHFLLIELCAVKFFEEDKLVRLATSIQGELRLAVS